LPSTLKIHRLPMSAVPLSVNDLHQF
jgi:hypothetical protein